MSAWWLSARTKKRDAREVDATCIGGTFCGCLRFERQEKCVKWGGVQGTSMSCYRGEEILRLCRAGRL
jgi:hypothetical protein